MFNLFLNRSFSSFTGCPHDLMPGSGLLSFFLVPVNIEMIQSMLGTSSPDGGLVIQYTHWYKLWVGHTYPSELTQDSLSSYSIWITTFLYFIPVSDKSSSTGTPTVVITDTNISGYQAPCKLPVLGCFLLPPINLTGGKFTTGTVLYVSILSFVNGTTGRCSAPSFKNDECAASVLRRTLILMHYPHNFPSTILLLCFTATLYCTTTSSLLSGAILWIITEIIPLFACVPRGVNWPLIRRIFAFHWNQIA